VRARECGHGGVDGFLVVADAEHEAHPLAAGVIAMKHGMDPASPELEVDGARIRRGGKRLNREQAAP
jgi:hypothetical protein